MSNTRKTRRTPVRGVSPSSPRGREIGVPDADLPGGLPHLVSAETPVQKVPVPKVQHVKAGEQHGVPDVDPDAPFAFPEAGKTVVTEPPPLPEEDLAVPVYLVERGHDVKKIRTGTVYGPVAVGAADTNTRRLCERDPERVEVYVAVTQAASGAVLVGPKDEVDQGFGILIQHGTVQAFKTQDSLYWQNTTGVAVTVSAMMITEVPVSGT